MELALMLVEGKFIPLKASSQVYCDFRVGKLVHPDPYSPPKDNEIVGYVNSVSGLFFPNRILTSVPRFYYDHVSTIVLVRMSQQFKYC